jgi:hypothetical protein
MGRVQSDANSKLWNEFPWLPFVFLVSWDQVVCGSILVNVLNLIQKWENIFRANEHRSGNVAIGYNDRLLCSGVPALSV